MAKPVIVWKSGKQLSARSVLSWRIAQTAVWLVGAFIMFCLFFFPSLGLLLFWNILIPVAPALLVVFTGLWRNVCPLATTILLPRHLNFSRRKKLSATQLGQLNFAALVLLFIIVPLRHAIFNNNGPATGLLILSLAVMGIGLGLVYEWKSAWCSGLCPVHPVEKLYGENVLMTLPNAHCHECMNCVIPCPDSTPNIHPQSSKKTIWACMSGFLITGGLPGFIWGWFHVPDETSFTNISGFLDVYQLPFACMMVTLVLYGLLSRYFKGTNSRTPVSIFAAAGVSCYYWYRIPSLFGFGNFGHDGLLIDLTHILPAWSISAITIVTTGFFFYWLVMRKKNNSSWVIRPPFGEKQVSGNQKLTV